MPAPVCCPICGQTLTPDARACPNRWCRRPDRGFTVVFAVGRHDAALRAAINRYKYRGDRRLGDVFAAMVADYVTAHGPWFEEIDLIGSVPAFTGPEARRGWDPVRAILEAAAVRLGPSWPVDPGLLVKTADTPRLAGRTWSERQSIARGPLRRSLALSPGRLVVGARVLVFDDVMTEGSTLREAARVLLHAGAAEVTGLVLARPALERGR